MKESSTAGYSKVTASEETTSRRQSKTPLYSVQELDSSLSTRKEKGVSISSTKANQEVDEKRIPSSRFESLVKKEDSAERETSSVKLMESSQVSDSEDRVDSKDIRRKSVSVEEEEDDSPLMKRKRSYYKRMHKMEEEMEEKERDSEKF